MLIAGWRAATAAATRRVDVAKLRVAVGVLPALQRLTRGLQAVPELAQQPRNGPKPDRMAPPAQLVGEAARALGRPQQHALGVAARLVLQEAAQHIQQLGVAVLGRRPARARLANPPRLERLLVELAQPLAYRVLRDLTRPRRRRDPSITERPRSDAANARR